MTDRHAPQPAVYDVAGGSETVIYSPVKAPADIDVTIFNSGDVVLKLRLGAADTPYIPIAVGTGLTVNTGLPIYATVDAGTTTAIVVLGVRTFASGVSSSGGALTTAELQSIAVARTQKELLVEILLQEKLQTELLKLIADTELTLSDFPNWSSAVTS